MRRSTRIGLRPVAGILALLLCLCACAPSTVAAHTPSGPTANSGRYAAIDAAIKDRMAATHTPGLSYAVVGPRGPIHQRSWGTDGQGERVTAHTPFLWGSVAKPVTATAVVTLVEAGRLSLDDRVVEYLPQFRFGGAGHANEVTIRQLLEQTAGVPESAMAEVTDCYGGDCGRPAERIGELNEVQPLGPPGTKYAYTSANYLILAAMVESVTEQPFADYLRRAALEPAGMDGAIADTTAATRRGLPPGHQLLWGVPSPVADEIDAHGASYGYLGGDLTDLAAFASLQLRSGRTADGRSVLTPESVQLMRDEGTLRPSATATGYGLGWRVGGLDAPLDDATWHTGASPGFSAMLFLLPEQHISIVVQQNLYGLLQDEAIMQVGFNAARMLAGGHPPDDGATAATYHLSIWSITVLALAMIFAAGRSGLLLRGAAMPASRRRHAVVTTAWCLTGALPCIAVILIGQTGLSLLRIWTPDGFTAVCVAAAAGAATLVLRLTLAAIRCVRARKSQPKAQQVA